MRTSIKFLGALAVAGLVAAGGSAFTASNTVAAGQVVGYGSTTITGATVSSMHYTLNDTGTNVNSVTLVLAGDMMAIPAGHAVASAVSIGFNQLATTPCGPGVLTEATTDPVAPAFTTYICQAGSGSFTQSTTDLVSTQIVVN
jgi:hypothetical protein